mmetsp:Transcript_96295/g.241387  ORF Transcript_96295/g.241387 Transcript_96295/m.241387 type:complete len:203 (-) Transcript_96295:1259-1867(-)
MLPLPLLPPTPPAWPPHRCLAAVKVPSAVGETSTVAVVAAAGIRDAGGTAADPASMLCGPSGRGGAGHWTEAAPERPCCVSAFCGSGVAETAMSAECSPRLPALAASGTGLMYLLAVHPTLLAGATGEAQRCDARGPPSGVEGVDGGITATDAALEAEVRAVASAGGGCKGGGAWLVEVWRLLLPLLLLPGSAWVEGILTTP